MSAAEPIAVLGGGTIGCGWAAVFAAAGHPTFVTDPEAAAAERLSQTWRSARPVLEQLDRCVPDPHPPVLVTAPDALPAVPAFVVEALPERLDLKRSALSALEAILPADTIIVTSSSGLSVSALQEGMTHPDRLVLGHPCNPPYLMPTVEVGGGDRTDPAAIDKAAALFEGLGKVVLRVRREVPGHLVNRLQAALWREAVHMAREGVASVADIERAVTDGLGARWSVIGPTTIFHLAGGPAGLPKFLDDLGGEVERWWASLGDPRLDERTRQILIDGMRDAADGRSPAEIAESRDAAMLAVLACLDTLSDQKERPQPEEEHQ